MWTDENRPFAFALEFTFVFTLVKYAYTWLQITYPESL